MILIESIVKLLTLLLIARLLDLIKFCSAAKMIVRILLQRLAMR